VLKALHVSIRTMLAFICLAGLVTAASAVFPTTASAQQLRRCANEGGICRLPYPTQVIYGARGRTTARFFDRRAVPCSNRLFGDPAPGRLIALCRQIDDVNRDRLSEPQGPRHPVGYRIIFQ